MALFIHTLRISQNGDIPMAWVTLSQSYRMCHLPAYESFPHLTTDLLVTLGQWL